MDMNFDKQEQKKSDDNFVKITITKDAAESLKELVSRVNDGFDGGQVHRQDIASWVISKFMASLSETDINQIRHLHYDDAAMFEAMYRKMKETGAIPDFLRDAMRKQFQGAPDAPKKSKKSLTREYINDVLDKHEEAA